MALEITPLRDAVVVELPERLDANNATELDAELHALLLTKQAKVILDFTRTEYVASAGLRVLLRNSRDFRSSGCQVTLVELSPPVQKIIGMAGFTKIFSIYVSKEEALRKMN